MQKFDLVAFAIFYYKTGVIKLNVFVLTNGNGMYIREDSHTRKYVPVKSYKQAKHWDSYEKAKSVLNNSIGKAIRSKYYVQTIRATEQQASENNVDIAETPPPLDSLAVSYDLPNNTIDKLNSSLNQVINAISNINVRKNELTEKLKVVQAKIVDVRHYIEFQNLNASDGWKVYKLLQDLLRERRDYKDQLLIIGFIEDTNVDIESLHKLSKRISGLKTRTYAPRALPELFEKRS